MWEKFWDDFAPGGLFYGGVDDDNFQTVVAKIVTKAIEKDRSDLLILLSEKSEQIKQ